MVTFQMCLWSGDVVHWLQGTILCFYSNVAVNVTTEEESSMVYSWPGIAGLDIQMVCIKPII